MNYYKSRLPPNLNLLSTREAGDWCKHFGIPVHKMKAERIKRLKAWLDGNKPQAKKFTSSDAPQQRQQQIMVTRPLPQQQQPATHQPSQNQSPVKLPAQQQGSAPPLFTKKLPKNLEELSTREAATWCRNFRISIPKLKSERINAIKAYLDKNKPRAEIDV